MTMTRVEVIAWVEKRRRWSREEKERLMGSGESFLVSGEFVNLRVVIATSR